MTLKDQIYADAHEDNIDQAITKMKELGIREGIEKLFDDEDALSEVTGPEAILMAGFLKAIYLMERLEEERKTLRYRLFLNGDSSYED